MFVFSQCQVRFQQFHAAGVSIALEATIATCYSPHSGSVLWLWNSKLTISPLLFLSTLLHFKFRWLYVRIRGLCTLMLTRNMINHRIDLSVFYTVSVLVFICGKFYAKLMRQIECRWYKEPTRRSSRV